MPREFRPNFTATGVGTLPHVDPEQAVSAVLARLTEMPYWPQLPHRDPREDMNQQYTGALEPLVGVAAAGEGPKAHPGMSREEALAAFYERLLAGDLASFAPRPQEAAGYFAFKQAVAAAPEGAFPWIKGHVTGPLTLAASISSGETGKALLYDDELALALAQGLGAAGAAQAADLGGLGRPVMIFFDEPFLSGYGSAFTPLSREKVLELLGACIGQMREHSDAVIGVHCCGNTDWGLLVDAGADVINLDSAGFGQHLLLYPKALAKLYARGGSVAWGAVPTLALTGQETADTLWAGLRALLEDLEQKGFDRQVLAAQALVTPACGMGSLDQEKALKILDLTAGVSRLAREQYA